MRHFILGISGLMGFITITICVFKNVAFYTILLRTGVVIMTTLLVGIVGISFVVLFGYLGMEKSKSKQNVGEENISTQ